MSLRTSYPTPPSMRKPGYAATRCTFPTEWCPCFPRSCPTGCARLNPKPIACAWLRNVDRPHRSCHPFSLSRSSLYSHARLTYEKVAEAVIDRDDNSRQTLGPLAEHLDELHALYQCLRAARERRGALEFDSVESHIVLDDARRVKRIENRVRNDAHRMIEECMITANVCAARFLAVTRCRRSTEYTTDHRKKSWPR